MKRIAWFILSAGFFVIMRIAFDNMRPSAIEATKLPLLELTLFLVVIVGSMFGTIACWLAAIVPFGNSVEGGENGKK